ncbi:rhodanese-like domain-containing protein [Campylobacter ureolyticus]|uniref:rhodanese-like domain-containing protein n=1 Tax=Campylobacter ureolyticus TaxID=827 RepID=UPI0022B3535B|nr:rhodanese-like domain-containing protein [Campylobacter ureolyticus]MCZ6103865.1 rhodanese-like domain-containing protein [Campylobacter ureolyticus]
MNKLIKNIFIATFVVLASAVITPQVHASGNGSMAFVDGVVPISISKAKELMNDGAYIFDANELEVRQEYGHVEGAVHINVDNWERLLPKDKDSVIIVYCLNRICYISSEIALEISKLGYKNVYVMIEGIEQWILSGNPIIKDAVDPADLKNKYLGNNNWEKSSKVTDYTDTIHRQILFGEIPSCRDCHGINVGSNAKSINADFASLRQNVNKNCMSCHDDVGEEFKSSVHGNVMSTKKGLPLCSDCHSIHMGPAVSSINMKKFADKKCGDCHQKEQAMYHTTFHGKAMLLENPGNAISVAACYDCHGTHNIYSVDDARSTLYKGEKRIETCASCHPGGNENFSEFMAHADHTDGENYPVLNFAYKFMTVLIIVVFGFFGIHTLLWFIRLTMTRMKYSKEWKEAKNRAHSDKVKIKRFTGFHKVQHFLLAASFLGLGFSGMPQKYHTADWAQSMIDLMGGPIGATKIHHISAFIMLAVVFSHFVEIIVVAYRNRRAVIDPNTGKFSWKIFWRKFFGPDSLVPNFQDFRDLKNNFLWFIGKKDKMPQFDRWTYWEKFDYIAVFWGMLIIGLSGLMLWFPVTFTKILPGQMLNLATFLHSDEALLALGFIFAVHFFHTHFRANKFPMDTVIFSGNLTEEEMKQERTPWYNRLKESGKFDELIVKDDNFDKWKWLAYIVGYAMLITGIIFLLMIIYYYIF